MKKPYTKKIAVIGGHGFIGSNFINFVLGTDRKLKVQQSDRLKAQIFFPSRHELDISDPEITLSYFEMIKPDAVVNFAAFRDANKAEIERGNENGPVWRTNVTGTENLVKACLKYKSYLIHISTDMVFSGNKSHKGPYDEKCPTETDINKLSWYGWTKAVGERRINRYHKAAVIRIGNVTQPVYDPSLDYVGKIIYLYDRKELYPLFNNQVLTLTPIPLLFKIINSLLETKLTGTFHAATSDTFTPLKLGQYLIGKARGTRYEIKGANIDEYLKKFPNRYPKYSGLKSAFTSRKLGIRPVTWKAVVDASLESFKK